MQRRLIASLATATAAIALGFAGPAIAVHAGASKHAKVWLAFDTGASDTCGITGGTPPGKLWCWGENNHGELGNGNQTTKASPTAVKGGGDWVQVSAGGEHTCGIQADSSLWCWGENASGELGLGDTTDRLMPVQVGSATDWTSVTTGLEHTCAIDTDNLLWCWGENSTGQLGLGDTTDRSTPTHVLPGSQWSQVSAGDIHTCGIQQSVSRTVQLSLWCWGDNSDGQLGLGTTVQQLVPAQVDLGGPDWLSVSSGSMHTCAIGNSASKRLANGLWCWGYNLHGQLGVGDFNEHNLPTQVTGGAAWKQVAAAGQHTCAVTTGKALFCWGWNRFGQLGVGDTQNRTTPAQTGIATTWTGVAGGDFHSCGLQKHSLWCWGGNSSGQLGQGDATQRLVPTKV